MKSRLSSREGRESLTEVEVELGEAGTSPALAKAKDTLAQGKKLLAEKQKLIRIADRSELGWGVVAEYTADELADDSDDEKRIEKAEKEAERKAGKKKRAEQVALTKRSTGLLGLNK